MNNINPALGLANGTSCFLHSIELSDTQRQSVDAANPGSVILLNDIPQYIIVLVKMNDIALWRSCGLEQYFHGETGYAFVKLNKFLDKGVTLIIEKAFNSNIVPNQKKIKLI